MSTTRHLEELLTRYNGLKQLRHRIDLELRGLSGDIERILGVAPERRLHRPVGRPRRPDVMAADEARECHRLYVRGHREERTIEGERQYQRNSRRTRKAAS